MLGEASRAMGEREGEDLLPDAARSVGQAGDNAVAGARGSGKGPHRRPGKIEKAQKTAREELRMLQPFLPPLRKCTTWTTDPKTGARSNVRTWLELKWKPEAEEEPRWGAAKALHPLGAAQGGVLGGAALACCRSSRESSPSSLTSMASKIAPTWLG